MQVKGGQQERHQERMESDAAPTELGIWAGRNYKDATPTALLYGARLCEPQQGDHLKGFRSC